MVVLRQILVLVAAGLALGSPAMADGLQFHGSFVKGYVGTVPESSARSAIEAPAIGAAEATPKKRKKKRETLYSHRPPSLCQRLRYDSFGVSTVGTAPCRYVRPAYGPRPYPGPYRPPAIIFHFDF